MQPLDGAWQITVRLEFAAQQITTIESSFCSTIQTRAKAEQQDKYDKFAPLTSLDCKMKLDLSPYLGKPFFVRTINWPATVSRFAAVGQSILPYEPIINIPAMKATITAGALYRTKFCVNLSLTGTIGHQGTLLAAVLPAQLAGISPNAYSPGIINTMLTSPHAFLSANEASSVCIEVPFYVNTDLAYMQTETDTQGPTPDLSWSGVSYANLLIIALNPLVPATGASTSLNVVMEVTFKELELYVPRPNPAVWTTQSAEVSPSRSVLNKASCACSVAMCCYKTICCCSEFIAESAPSVTIVADSPGSDRKDMSGFVTRAADFAASGAKIVVGDFIDSLRRTFRFYTGLHNPNIAMLRKKMIMTPRNYANQIDSGTCLEKMDPYSDFDRITKYPIFRTHEDEMMLASILSKPQYLGTFQVNTTDVSGKLLWSRPISPWQGGCVSGTKIANNIEALYWMTRAWKGDMEVIIQSNMTPKHSLKLKAVKYYAPDVKALAQFPTMVSVTNAVTDTLEFSQGGQTLTIQMPFLSRNQMLYNTKDPRANALQHGILYVYLLQPLVVTDNVATTVEFNVYMKCKENFSYFGYSTDPVAVSSGFTAATDAEESDEQRSLINKSETPVTQIPPSVTPVVSPLEKAISNNKRKPRDVGDFVTESAEVMNAPSSQSDLLTHGEEQEDLVIDRMIPLVDIRPLIRRFQYSGRITYTHSSGASNTIIIPVGLLVDSWRNNSAKGSRLVATRMFYGYNGGVKYKIKIFGAPGATLRYIPPGICMNATGTNYFKTQPDTSQFGYWLENSTNGSNSSVMTELPSLAYPMLSSGSTSTVSLFEGVIPHNTIYNFLGSMEWFKGTGDSSSTTGPMNDLGYLYFDLNLPVGSTETVTAVYYSAFTDETRFGFHTFAPVLNIPVSAGNYVLVGEIPTGSVSSAPTAISTAQPPFAYYSSLSTSFST